MKGITNDGGPAFPTAERAYTSLKRGDGEGKPIELAINEIHAQPGMTLRQWYAGQALAGIMANPHIDPQIVGQTIAAYWAFQHADAMIKFEAELQAQADRELDRR